MKIKIKKLSFIIRHMTKILKVLFLITIAYTFVLSAWYVLHRDIDFAPEVARDFFLLDELDRKKIVLIGPSSTTGLFHGPLWTYINYPAYFIGNGNPVIVGWGWILMIGAFLISGFYIAKNLFGIKTAYFFVLMISVYSIFHAKGLYNPHGAMFVIPAFFFFLIRYLQTYTLKFLIIHILFTGVLIQFQMAIGVPFLILSFVYVAFMVIKRRKKKHLFVYLLIFVTLMNFIIFDLRHELLLSKLGLRFLHPSGTGDIFSMVYQRVKFMTTGIEFLRPDSGYRNLILFLMSSFFLFFQIRDKKYKTIYYTFLYFYFGFLILSNLNSGGLLYFYLFPLFPLVFLIFSSFVTSRYYKVFTALLLIIIIFNLNSATKDIINAKNNFIGKDETSWLFLKNAGTKIFQGKENEFGYFVYHPDIVAYRGKYVLQYLHKSSSKKAYYFQKKPITYLFIAPPPRDRPFMKDEWWTVNLLHINKKPDHVFHFQNGYKIEKYVLTDQEIKIPVEKGIDPGIHFR